MSSDNQESMILAVREYMYEKIESYYADYGATIDLNNTIWKDSIDAFNTFYKYFNNDKIDLTNPEDVVKPIVFTRCYCEMLSCGKIKLDEEGRNYILLTLARVHDSFCDTVRSVNSRIPKCPLFPMIYNAEVNIHKVLTKFPLQIRI